MSLSDIDVWWRMRGSTDAQLQLKCPSTPTPAAQEVFSVYCNLIGSFEIFFSSFCKDHIVNIAFASSD